MVLPTESDNLRVVPEISATEASRNFAALLDAIEQRGERFTIVRRGRVVAELGPGAEMSGADLKALLRSSPVDPDWAEELTGLRDLVKLEERF
jgi:antitoxin (DNA-binding transcriptional repressor) of toxin-antitoxin stability system